MNTSLKELRVLVLDCQASGTDPDKDRLLEAGWALTEARGPDPLPGSHESHLVAWEREASIPRRVARVTGITDDDLTSSSARALEEIWTRLAACAREVARGQQAELCPTVIHFARFEVPHLMTLHGRMEIDAVFPLEIVCTHEIAKRLLPELPRRGLRAVAGYLGHTVPELRRTAHHVTATAFIWHHMVGRLEQTHGVRTLPDLRRWLEATEPPSSRPRSYPMDTAARLRLPDRPGVYRMRRSNGDLLYVGKARSLHRRVNSYFQKKRHHPEHTLEMLTQARRVDVTETGTALEAALLEVDEIKRFSPAYNIALRDRDRNLAFSSPDLKRTSSRLDQDHPIGPFPSEATVRCLGALAGILHPGPENPVDIRDALRQMGLPAERSPEPPCFASGLELFRQRYLDHLDRSPAPAALLRVGRELWLERLHVRDEESTEDEDPAQEQAEEGWTAERVAGWMEGLALRGAFLIRRARWLCLLSECSLAWERRRSDEPTKTLAVLSEGHLLEREERRSTDPIPTPPGYRRSFRERQGSFTLGTYDRLIVLTTEMRRLVGEERKVELRLSPKTLLRNEHLVKALQWV